MLDRLSTSLTSTIKKLKGISLVDEAIVNEVTSDIRRALLSADVNVELVQRMIKRVKIKALEDKIPPRVSRKDYVIKVIFDELIAILGKKHYPLRLNPQDFNKLLFIGIQGSGKTTSIAKLAVYLKKRGYKVGVIGADTFRPGAYQQLKQLLDPYEIQLYGAKKPGLNALKTVKEGLKYYTDDKKMNIIIIDTSGRHKEEKSLFKEIKQINKAVQPTETILVIDGTIGQLAHTQADAFNQAISTGSIILTKLDGSAKGGGAISAVAATGTKIRFLATGEKINDIEDFDPVRFVSNILGMGDIKGIIERIKDAGLMEDQEELAEAFKKGKMTLRIYRGQMEKMLGAGSLSWLIGRLPGLGSKLPDGAEKHSKENAKKIIGICNSFTPEELDNHTILNRSRIERVARGSGCTINEVKAMLKQFEMIARSLKKIRKDRKKRLPFGGSGMDMSGFGM